MPTFDVAEILEQDRNAVIVFLPSETTQLSSDARVQLRSMLEREAAHAGMIGEVIAVWEYEGNIRFMAHQGWHDYILSCTVADLEKRISGKLVFE